MKRRTLLNATSIGTLAIPGCLGLATWGGDRDFPSVSVETEKKQQEDVTLRAEVIRQFSESAPAKVSISFTNDSDSEIEFTFGASPPFSQYTSQGSSSSRLVIIPDSNNSHISLHDTEGSVELPPKTKVNGCWELPGLEAVYGRAQKETISAGESISEEYAVLNHSKNRQCLPTGEYRFVSEAYFGQDEPWGITIQLQHKKNK